MIVGSLSGSITSFVGSHGVYAVFVLMAIDAVFPAASELVMLYAGALAAGVFPSQHVLVFGSRLGHGAASFVALALAGSLGYLLGSLLGWAIGAYGGRTLVERHGRWLRSPLASYTALTFAGSLVWCFAFAGAGYGLGASYARIHHDFRLVDYAVVAIVAWTLLYTLRLRRAARTQNSYLHLDRRLIICAPDEGGEFVEIVSDAYATQKAHLVSQLHFAGVRPDEAASLAPGLLAKRREFEARWQCEQAAARRRQRAAALARAQFWRKRSAEEA